MFFNSTQEGVPLDPTINSAALIVITKPGSVTTTTPSLVSAETPARIAYVATTSTVLLAANTARKGFTIFNDSDQNLYVRKQAAVASITAFNVRIPPYTLYEDNEPVYSGEVRGYWEAGGNIATMGAQVAEKIV